MVNILKIKDGIDKLVSMDMDTIELYTKNNEPIHKWEFMDEMMALELYNTLEEPLDVLKDKNNILPPPLHQINTKNVEFYIMKREVFEYVDITQKEYFKYFNKISNNEYNTSSEEEDPDYSPSISESDSDIDEDDSFELEE